MFLYLEQEYIGNYNINIDYIFIILQTTQSYICFESFLFIY